MLKNSGETLITFAVIISFILLSTISGQASGEEIRSRVLTGLPRVGSDYAGAAGSETNITALQQLTPLESLLNADGTVKLNTGFRGSLDVKGWKMAVSRNGEPHFVQEENQSSSLEAATLPDDIYWDNRFAKPGVGDVYALVFSEGGLYVGGRLNIAGGANIAKWDGTKWSALGSGVDGAVYGIAMKDNDVYVCGEFVHAGGQEASGVAKWDGTKWSALGSGVFRICPTCFGIATTIAISGNDVYIGGTFTSVGGVNAEGIAKWDGTSWSTLGTGIQGSSFDGIRSIVVIGTDVYVGGNFFSAGGVVVHGIARWDGARWSALGSGIGGLVYVIATNGSDLYVGGLFDTAGDVPAKNIAKWDGAKWSALGSGTVGPISALAASGNRVYAGIDLRLPFGEQVDHIVEWNGASWSTMGSGVRYDIDDRAVRVSALAANGTDVYVSGDFILAGGLFARGLAKWDGTDWSVMGKGPGGTVDALLVNGNELFVAGSFDDVAGIRASGVAKWDGTGWSALGAPSDGVRFFGVRTMAVIGNKLYTGGQVLVPGEVIPVDGHVTNHVAVWDGSNWSILDSGFRNCSGLICASTINAMTVIGTDLYVGGAFHTVDKVNVNNIARWDGAKWSAVGAGVDADVQAMAVSSTDLYVGGFFKLAGGGTANGVAKWDGREWSSLGRGVNGFVFAITVSGNNLYVGGNFSKAGGEKANNIARWNGRDWFALGDGTDGGVFALAGNGGNIYAAGQFARAGIVSAKDIARWNGRDWSALGSGVNFNDFPGFGLAVTVFKEDVYVGGVFDTAGGKPSYGFARWSGPADQAPGPKITAASVSGKKLFVSGQNFDKGASVLINGEEQKTTNDAGNPGTGLIAKKAGKKVKAGDKLRVRNTDGTLSEEFTF